MTRAFSKIWIIGILAVIIAGGFFVWQKFGPQKKETGAPEVVKVETAGWNSYKDEISGIEFKYPRDLGKKYIATYTWPPKITVEAIESNFICEQSQNIKTAQGYGKQEEVIINNSKYCVLSVGEGAAGSTYATYKYITDKKDKRLNIEFVLRFTNCGVFYGEDNKMEECEKENKDFEPAELIDQVLSTLRFLE